MVEQFQFFMDKANIDFARSLEQRVADALKDKKITIAVAESLTGGLVSKMLTTMPGSSDFFIGGAICYSPRAKVLQTGIDPKVIAQHGVVSGETAAGIARGIRHRLFTDLGIGITGVAGPEAHGGKPVGTVFIAVADKERDLIKEYAIDGNNREDIRTKAAQAVLGLLWLYFQDIEEK